MTWITYSFVDELNHIAAWLLVFFGFAAAELKKAREDK